MKILLILLQVVIWDSMPNATIYQDTLLKQMMEDHWQGTMRSEQGLTGWRVQIYSSNNQLIAKQEAEALKEKLENVLEEPIYVDFMQPFWKVRVGNFLTIEDAKAYRERLIEQLPELQSESYPVRDQIILKR